MRYAFGDFILDVELGELLRGGEVVTLRRQTFRLLALLVERAPALLSRDTLLDEIWGRTALSPNAVPQAISELRRALGDEAQAPRYIETRHRRGYRFIAPVQRQEPASARVAVDLSGVEPPPVRPSEPARHTRQRRRPLPYVAVLIAILILGAWVVTREYHPSDPATAELQGRPQRLALAALPADADVPAWVPVAALEMFAPHLSDARLRLLRADALGLANHTLDARWQHQVHDLLGAQFAPGGYWRRASNGDLVLDLSVIDLADGHIVSSRSIVGHQDQLDALVQKASAVIAAALQVAPLDVKASPVAMHADEAARYGRALLALNAGDSVVAAQSLRESYARLGQPNWMDSSVIDALVQAGDHAAALVLLDTRLDTPESLPLGERLRLQAKAAALRHQPAARAAALRALMDLYPDDVESAIALVESEIDALQGVSARSSLARLSGLPAARNDPRVHLLRSRLARLDNDFALAQSAAAAAAQTARQYELPQLALAAAMAEADALQGLGQLDEGARLLAENDSLWAAGADASALFDLRIRRIQLLREQGRLDDVQSLVEQVRPIAATAQARARLGIEVALLQIQRGHATDADLGLQQIKSIITAEHDPDLETAWFNADALAALARNDAGRAQQSFAAAFARARANGRAGQNVALQVNAGLALMRQKRYVEADQQWQQALATFEALGDRRGQATCLGNLAASASTQGQLERSVELNIRALELFRALHLAGPQARTAYNLALAATRDGNLESAVNYYKEAGTVWQSAGQHDLALRATVGQAEIALTSGDQDAAQRLLDLATPIEQASPLSRSHALATAAQIALAKGDLQASRSLQQQALDLRTQDGNAAWIALSELELLRDDLLSNGDLVRVQIGAEELAKRFAQLGERRDEARAWLLVADAQLSRNKSKQAQQSIDRARRASESFSDRSLGFDLEWANAWVGDRDERILRLQMLQQKARDAGYLAQAARATQALAARSSDASNVFANWLPLPPYAQPKATGQPVVHDQRDAAERTP